MVDRCSCACKSPNLYQHLLAPKYCKRTVSTIVNESFSRASLFIMLLEIHHLSSMGEPFHQSLCKILPGLPTAVQLWSSPCCSSGLQIMVPKVPNSSPPPPHFALLTLLVQVLTQLTSSYPFYWHNIVTIPPAAQSHPTAFYESTPVCGRIGSASTWLGAGSPVNA